MFIKEIYEGVHKSFIPKNQKTRNNPNIYQQENWSVNCSTFLQWETIQLQEVVAVWTTATHSLDDFRRWNDKQIMSDQKN